ncbi:hypothetical protein ACFSTJ_20090 [Ottowia pentelensis]|uniref:hypothetical protein n=1 Tax=Ottowia pentelensis TaxID=511108 RepID=UPI0036372160
MSVDRTRQPDPVFDRIPPELAIRDRWLLWRAEGGKKVPYRAAEPRKRASSTDPTSWAGFDATRAAYRPGRDAGIGFALVPEDGLTVIDIDGNTSPEAVGLLEDVGCRFIETSPSGNGLHGWGFFAGELPRKKGIYHGINVEIYNAGRYMSVTGNATRSGPFSGLHGVLDLSRSIASSPAEKSRRPLALHKRHKNLKNHMRHRNLKSWGLCGGVEPARFLPKTTGNRNKRLFDLARHVKANRPEATKDELRAIAMQWHELALPTIGTKAFAETWGDFSRAWENVKYPEGALLAKILDNLDGDPIPPMPSGYGETEERLIRVCIRLQQYAGNAPFFLSARKAGDLIGLHFTNASAMLCGLVADGVLELVERGKRPKASSYRFKWGQPEQRHNDANHGRRRHRLAPR